MRSKLKEENSDSGSWAEEKTCGYRVDVRRGGLRVLAETPGPPAESSLTTANFILERSALDENIYIFVGHLILFCESGFLFAIE